MKRRDFLTLGGTALLAGCASWGKIDPATGVPVIDPKVTEFLVESAGIPIGYFGAKYAHLDTALRAAYELAKDGKLTPETANKILALLDAQDPIEKLMAGRLLSAAGLLGAIVIPGVDDIPGRVIDFSNMDPVLIEALARGYAEGFEVGKEEFIR